MPHGSTADLRLASPPVVMGIGELQESRELRVVDLQKHDIILGAPWLNNHSPRINWRAGRMLLSNNGSPIAAQAIPQKPLQSLITAKQLSRLAKKHRQPIFAVTAQNILSDARAKELLPSRIQDLAALPAYAWRSCLKASHHLCSATTRLP